MKIPAMWTALPARSLKTVAPAPAPKINVRRSMKNASPSPTPALTTKTAVAVSAQLDSVATRVVTAPKKATAARTEKIAAPAAASAHLQRSLVPAPRHPMVRAIARALLARSATIATNAAADSAPAMATPAPRFASAPQAVVRQEKSAELMLNVAGAT